MGTAVAIESCMDCFFGTYDLPDQQNDRQNAVVTFNIPDVGIRFKAPFRGANGNHCHLASLLALLEFIDGNQKYFVNHTYQIFGNNYKIINQVNGRESFPPEFSPLMDKAEGYRKKYGYSLEWIPTAENPAYDILFD